MPFYSVYGRDPRSDSGAFEIIIEARDKRSARVVAISQLKVLNRDDLIRDGFEIDTLNSGGGIITHNVQHRN